MTIKLQYPTEWFEELILWIRQRVEGFEIDTLHLKHEIGSKILPFYKEKKFKKGTGATISELAHRIGWSNSEIYECLKFANNYPRVDDALRELSDLSETPTWYNVVRVLLYKGKREHLEQPDYLEIPETADGLKQDYFMTNVWVLSERRPEGYGSPDFRGNCDPTIIDQCLRRYLNPFSGELVLDPMAGSGTFLDVVNRLNETLPENKRLRADGYDLTPRRSDIQLADAEHLSSVDKETVSLIFCHFPYWTMWKYSESADDLSNMPYEAFKVKVGKIFAEFNRVLKHSGFLCILIGNKRQQGIIDIEADLSKIGQEFFTLWDKVIVTGTESAGRHAHTAHGEWGIVAHRALKGKWTIQNYDTLLVFRKE